ncbi:MAG: ABC transporter permease subunit [Idiomarina sp.]
MTTNTKQSQLAANRGRLFKDRATRWGVTFGGGMVLIALLLIFFYLLYVVEPIFRSVDVNKQHEFDIPGGGSTLAMGVEEQSEIGYRFNDLGELIFFATEASERLNRNVGDVLLSELVTNSVPTAFAMTAPQNNRYALAHSQGQVTVVQPKFRVSFPNDLRTIEPVIDIISGAEPLQVDERGQAIRKLAYDYDGESMLFAAVTDDNRFIVNKFVGSENFMTGAVELAPNFTEVEFNGTVDELEVTPDLRQIFARKGNRIYVFEVGINGEVSESQLLTVNAKELGNVTTMELLAGASSLVIGHDSGAISQWFQVPSATGRQYEYIRKFQAAEAAITEIVVEYYRRTFYAIDANGELGVFHTTSEANLYQERPADVAAERAVIDPRANSLMVQANNKMHFYDLDNEHPEVSWSGIWQEVWYEGYPEPTYTWQSTSGSDDFEPKFSLVPISFGTIKAAAYAMLVAVPLGLAAAVYTAYFMSPSVRKVVKPTVELMEALPTVILGFLAGLWLAPVIEQYLPGIVSVLILIPLTIILLAFISTKLPLKIRQQLTDGRAALILLPFILFVGWASFAASPLVEEFLFDGNVRGFITNELGVTFDQRNSIVVGVAMGFAVIPTIFSIAEDAVFSVPKHLSNGSLALGATTWQTLTKVVLLTASPGIFSAVMMGLGRAVGETMIVLMATGNTPIMDWNIFEGMRTLSANIAVEMPESEVGGTHYRILFLAAFVLFIFTFMFNTVAELVRQRLRDKYSSM